MINRMHINLSAVCFVLVTLLTSGQAFAQVERPSADNYQNELPWDYKPYEVLIWIAGLDESTVEQQVREPLLAYLDRDFRSLWRTTIVPAPNDMSAIARRDFEAITYDMLTSSDPIVLVKRDHPEAARIRFQNDVATHIKAIRASAAHAVAVQERGAAVDNGDLHGMWPKIAGEDIDLLTLVKKWQDPSTEAMLLPRGMTVGLKPEPKLVDINVSGRMGEMLQSFDKLFVVDVSRVPEGYRIRTREIDCLMRHPGPIIEHVVPTNQQVPHAIGLTARDAFAPMVRFDEVGTQSVNGLLRAGGLIMDEESPANIRVGEFVQPLLRKDDRTGEPAMVGVIDWAYLAVTEKDQSKIKLVIHDGRGGALAGRRNDRTHRMGLKIRPVFENTVLRLYLKGNPQQPLAGYDVYDRNLATKEYTLVGQTDWDGRLTIEKTEIPMRLLYVKNGNNVLAKLPVVPGQSDIESADMVGDDVRLWAESYIRGIQNSIIDLVAIRKLLAANIRAQIAAGNLDRATEMLDQLRKEPSYKALADDMAAKQEEIQSPNRNEQAKIQKLFGETRELLVEHINQSLINELDRELNAAKGLPVGGQPAAGDNAGGQ